MLMSITIATAMLVLILTAFRYTNTERADTLLIKRDSMGTINFDIIEIIKVGLVTLGPLTMTEQIGQWDIWLVITVTAGGYNLLKWVAVITSTSLERIEPF